MKQIFVSLFIAVAVAMIGVGIIAPILPLYAKSFAASGLSIGLVFSAFSLSRSLLGPLVGRLSDRVGRKRILMIGLAGYTVVSLLYVAAMSLWQLGLFRLLQGAASVMVTPIAQAYIGDITPPGKEGRYMNLFYSSLFLGMAIGPLLGGGLSALWSYQIPFYAMGLLSFIALLLVARAVPSDHGKSEAGHNRPREIAPMRDVLKNDAVKVICVYVATRGFWRQGFNTFYPLYAVAASGLGEASIGTVLSVYMLGGGLLQIPFGFLADRYPRFPQIVLGSTLPPLLLLAIPFVHKMWMVILITFAHKMWMVILITFAMGAFSALSRASILAIRTDLGRRHGMGTLAGLQGGAFAVGQMVGPLAYGAVADLVGLAAVFPFGSAVGLVGTGFVIGWFRRWERAGKPV
jgi:MFS family permease